MAGSIALSEDEIDDLLYFSRAGSLSDLKELAESLRNSHSDSPSLSSLVVSAIDPFTGNSPLHYASANGHVEIVQYLLSGSDNTSLTAACTVKNSSGNTPLHYAALNGQIEIVRALVAKLPATERGAFILLKNDAGYDAAFEAENAGKEGWEAVVSFLLENGPVEANAGKEEVSDASNEDVVETPKTNGSSGETSSSEAPNGDADAMKDAESRLEKVQLNGQAGD